MEQAYNPATRKQVILMRKNISITTYNYKVYIQIKNKTIKVIHTSRQRHGQHP